MWRTEVVSTEPHDWGLHSSHHLLNTKTLTAMSYFWGTTYFNNTLRYSTCSFLFKRKYYCKFWKNSSTKSIIRSLNFWRELETNARTLKQHLQIFLSWASAISGLSQQLYLGHSLLHFAPLWALKRLENETYLYKYLYAEKRHANVFIIYTGQAQWLKLNHLEKNILKKMTKCPPPLWTHIIV